MIDTLKELLPIVSACLSALAIIVYAMLLVFTKFKKALKKKDYLEENQELKEEVEDEGDLLTLYKLIIPNAVKLAEANKLLTGDTKKTIAKANIIQACQEDEIDYKKHDKEIDEYIEALIDVSKSVNVGSK